MTAKAAIGRVRGAILRDLREAKDPSQQFAATQVGVTDKTFRSWEQGGPIQPHHLEALAAYYGVEARRLIEQPKAAKRRPQQLPQLDRIEAKIDRILAALSPPDEAEADPQRPTRPPGQPPQVTSDERQIRRRKAN